MKLSHFSKMPFRRRATRFRRRRTGGFRGKSRTLRFKRRTPGVWSAIRNINKRLASEVRKLDVNTADATIDAAGAIFPLTAIAQGDERSQRQGNQVANKYLTAYGSITLGAVAANGVRMVVFQDTKMVADTNTAIGDVITGSTYRGLLNALSATTGRFNILYNKMFVNRVGAGVAEQIPFKKTFKIANLPRPKYNGAASTDLDNNQFFMIVIAETDETGAVDINWRYGYYDN